MGITLEKTTQTASFYSPLADFERVEVDVEIRFDPLTDRHARIVPESFVMPDDPPDIDPVVSDDEGCFFCPENVTAVTPKYPEWVGMDRGSTGEATSFPNLNPYGAYSNVIALTADHYVPINEFSPSVFADGLDAAFEYISTVCDHDADARFGSVNMNFLPAAGSSIVHPHIQTLVDDRGTTMQARRAAARRAFRDAHGSGYWSELLRVESDSDRDIGSTGSVRWIAPFAPRHHRHIQGIADFTGIPDGNSAVSRDFAAGITAVLQYYGAVGLNSFNFALVVAEGQRPVIDIIARSVFDAYYWSDSPFFTVLHGEGVVDDPPESYADGVREHL